VRRAGLRAAKSLLLGSGIGTMSLFHGPLLYLQIHTVPGPAKNISTFHIISIVGGLTDRSQALRKIFWQVIVENKQGLGVETTFDFKYIPDLSKTTHMEDAPETGIKQSGIERRNLQALIIGFASLAFAGYLGFKVTVYVGKRVIDSWIQ